MTPSASQSDKGVAATSGNEVAANIVLSDQDAFKKDMDILNAAWREFQYRNDNFWNILKNSVIIHTAFISVPMLLKQGNLPTVYSIPFIIISMYFTIRTADVLISESFKMNCPAIVYRNAFEKHMTQDQKGAYQLYHYPDERLIVTINEKPNLFKRLIAKILKNHFIKDNKYYYDARHIARSKFSHTIPMYWLWYGLGSSLLVLFFTTLQWAYPLFHDLIKIVIGR